MKHILTIAILALSTMAAPALAGDMSGYFGNTVMCKYANGDITRVYVDKDGTFTVVPTGHPSSSGTWKDDGSNVCYTQTSPAPTADMKQVCNSSQARAVGDSWPVSDPFGGQCTATLAAGHQ